MSNDINVSRRTGMTITEEMSLFGESTARSFLNDLRIKLSYENLSQSLYLTLIMLIGIRIVAIWTTSDANSIDPFYLYRHAIFTTVWAIILFYFLVLFLIQASKSTLIQNLREMERVSLLAFIASLVKFATSAVYIFYNRFSQLAFNWVTAYYIGELLIWALLAVFMYHSWKTNRQKRIFTQQHGFES